MYCNKFHKNNHSNIDRNINKFFSKCTPVKKPKKIISIHFIIYIFFVNSYVTMTYSFYVRLCKMPFSVQEVLRHHKQHGAKKLLKMSLNKNWTLIRLERGNK